MSRILTACAVLALAACAPKEDANGDGIVDGVQTPNSVSQVAPSTPVGTISGVVVNSQGAGLEGVQVVLVLGQGSDASRTWKTTTIAPDGAYVFKDVPAGSNAQLLFTRTGYSNARLDGSVPGAVGNFPLNNGNGNAGVLTLTQLTGTLKLRVYTAQGRPAKGAKAFLEVTRTAFQSFAGTYGSPCGNFSGTSEVDENGLLTFSGVPDISELARIDSTINYTVTIGALDEDMDGRTDALGTITNITAGSLFINPDRTIDRTIILADARATGGLTILATSLASFGAALSPPYRNAVKANDAITIVFNQPITQVDTTRLVKVVQEDCQTNVPVTMMQRAPNVLSIAPASSWTLGNRYNIIVRATGLDTGTTNDFIGYFFAIDATAPRALSTTAAFQVRKVAPNTMSNSLQPNDTLHVLFDTPIIDQAGSAQAIVNFDLNGDNITGGTMPPTPGNGEFNGPPNTGFLLTMEEQTVANDPNLGTFTCKRSGYSSRWSIAPINPFPASGFIPANTEMKVIFPKDQASSDTFQTAWGSPVAADVRGTITIVPP